MHPTTPITNPAFRYVPAANTDVMTTFRRAGWVPPSEAKLVAALKPWRMVNRA